MKLRWIIGYPFAIFFIVIGTLMMIPMDRGSFLGSVPIMIGVFLILIWSGLWDYIENSW